MFTGRFASPPGPVRFDRICHEHGVEHLLTAPYSPTTTGKVERFHKTLRRELLDLHVFGDLEAAQELVDVWVEHYNTRRPHQSVGDRPPIERFRLATPRPATTGRGRRRPEELPVLPADAITRRVSGDGHHQRGRVRSTGWGVGWPARLSQW